MKKEALKTAREALMILHKSLLEFQKEILEKESGQKMNPYEALNAALNDERFSWLKTISQMIVQLDIESEDMHNPNRKSPVLDPQEMKAFFSNPPSAFQQQLLLAIQNNPDITFLYSTARQSILNI